MNVIFLPDIPCCASALCMGERDMERERETKAEKERETEGKKDVLVWGWIKAYNPIWLY